MSGKKAKKTPSNQIANNKRARFEYFIEEVLEDGIFLPAIQSSGEAAE